MRTKGLRLGAAVMITVLIMRNGPVMPAIVYADSETGLVLESADGEEPTESDEETEEEPSAGNSDETESDESTEPEEEETPETIESSEEETEESFSADEEPEEKESDDGELLDMSTPSEAELMEDVELGTPSSAVMAELTDIPLEAANFLEELQQQIGEGETNRILATADIVVKPGDNLFLESEQAVTVDMNGCRLVISPDSGLSVTGPICFEGEAEGGALVSVEGRLSLKGGAEIRARGQESAAVLCDGDGSVTTWDAAIKSRGTGSRAVVWQSSAECRLEYAYIEAEGSGSVGIRADSLVHLFLCSVKAGGKSVEGTDDVYLDASMADPKLPQAEIVTREAYPQGREEENGFSVTAGADMEALLNLLSKSMLYGFYDPSGQKEPVGMLWDVTWSGIPGDLSRAGDYTAVCRPKPLNSWCGLRLQDRRIPIHVVDPQKPHIQEIFRMGSDVAFRYLTEIDGEELRLLYSLDGGKSWQDAAARSEGSLILNKYIAALGGLEINRDYLFKLVVTGGPMEGESSAVPFYYYEDDYDRLSHGDRDGDSRGGQGEALPNSVLPIFSNQEASDSNHWTVTGDGGKEEILPTEYDEEPETLPESDLEGTAPPLSGIAGGVNLPEKDSCKEEREEETEHVPDSGQQVSDGSALPVTPAAIVQANVVLPYRQFCDQLLANEKWITLTAADIKVELPVDSLKKLALREDEAFSAQIGRPAADQFVVRFWAGEQEITDFGDHDFTVELDWRDGDGSETVIFERLDGVKVQADLSDQKLKSRIQKPGEYYIQAERNVPANGHSQPFHAAMGAAGVGAAAFLSLLWYIRRPKGGGR